jgi:ribokinase
VKNIIELITCGAINWDINLFLDRLPRPGEEVVIQEIERVSGGTAANVAVAGARILGEEKVAFIGALGEDPIGEEQESTLRGEGIDTSGILFTKDEESGQAYISIGSTGENEIHTYFGANLKLIPESLDATERRDLISTAKICVIMDPPLETAEHLAQICKEEDTMVIWDPGVYSDLGLDALMPTISNVDYFILNNIEFENLLGTSKPQEVIRMLENRADGIKVIVKEGEEGSTLARSKPGAIIHIDAVPLKDLDMKVVNTVGCGDAFIGAFAAAKVQDMDDIEALRYGNAAGSFKATRRETRGSPTQGELIELLEKWEKL